jgi:hypothetical protein
VLAHVNVGAIASSCHSPAWIAWAAERLGAANERALAEDARTIASSARTHDDLARLQLLALLWNDEEGVRAATDRDLAQLRPEDVVDAIALRSAVSAGATAEVLRAATELELPLVATLPAPLLDDAALDDAFARVRPLAPEIARFEIRTVRALGVRGRAYPKKILVGTPGIAGADAVHIAWQAAHEAIVASISPAFPASFEDLERRAIGTLRARAKRGGLGDDHARWLSHFDLSALGAIPDVPDGS